MGGQLACLLEPGGRPRDGLERPVEDPQCSLGHVADDVSAAGLQLHHVKALDRDLLGQLAVDLDAEDGDLARHEGVQTPVDPAHGWRSLALEALDLLAGPANGVAGNLGSRSRGADGKLLNCGRGVGKVGSHVQTSS